MEGPITIRRLVEVGGGETGLQKLGYDPVTKVLRAQQHGALYQHYEIPPDLYVKLLNSEQPTAYYAKFVQGKFRRERIE